MANHSNTTDSVVYFMVGWFKYPKDLDVNYDAIEIAHNVIIFSSLPLNLLLLALIITNPGRKMRSNMSAILGNLCVLNLVANSITTVYQIEIIYRGTDKPRFISNKIMACVLSMVIINYYTSTLLLALHTYGMIVKPIQYKACSPKLRTTLYMTLVLWLVTAAIFVLLPYFIDEDLAILQTIAVSFCWLTTLIMLVLYATIINTLRLRKIELQNTLNATASRQGLLVVKQNSRLTRVLFLYISFMVLMSLPIGTCMFLLLNCQACNNTLTLKIILYLIPLAVFMSALFPIHWLLGTPQYLKELRRLGTKLCSCLKHEGQRDVTQTSM